jgi:calcineurin-like phosphoesterase family protein
VNTFFTSDHHFGHVRILELSSRPFKDVDEMDEKLILNWNSVVQPGDVVWHLGDIMMGTKPPETYLDRLNGTIHLVLGNHDKKALRVRQRFASISRVAEVVVDGQQITMCHYAWKIWPDSEHLTWMLYGHSHGDMVDEHDLDSLSLDVGVDCHNYFPISFDQVRELMKLRRFTPVDHHGDPSKS